MANRTARHGYNRIYSDPLSQIQPTHYEFAFREDFSEGKSIVEVMHPAHIALYHGIAELLMDEARAYAQAAKITGERIEQMQRDEATDLAIIRGRVRASRLHLHEPMEEELQGPINRFVLGLPMQTQQRIAAENNAARNATDEIAMTLEDAVEEEGYIRLLRYDRAPQ
jgi:hypothetical protein